MKRATNSAVMRQSNRKLILNLIRTEQLSRADIAESTGLTRASVTQIVDELIADGLVKEQSVIESTALGRKRTALTLEEKAGYAFGISLHRRHAYVGVAQLCGKTLYEERIEIEGRDHTEVIDCLCERIKAIRDKLKLPQSKIIGVGISAPGPVDYRRGAILNPPNFGGWKNVPICEMVSERTGYSVLLEKDSNARALEERFFGAASDCADFMLVQIGAGVGSGVVSCDRLYRGKSGRSTEIGHISVRADGAVCDCGNVGCLEVCLNIGDLLGATRFTSWKELMNDADAADAAEILDIAAGYLSTAFVSAFNLFDIDKIIVVGSDFAGAAEPLISRINQTVKARILSRDALEADPVTEGSTVGGARTGAMAMIYSMFSDRE